MATVLEADHVKKYFPTGASKWLLRPTDQVLAVDDISFKLEAGTTLGVVGESGCGKSTLGRVLAMLLKPTEGSVRLNGVDLATLNERDLNQVRRDIQFVFQDPYACLNPRHSIGESIATPMKVQKTHDKQGRRQRVQELMELVGLNPEHFNRFPHEFSGGQRQRVGIARALALNPKIIVADEPVSALDVSIQSQILNLLEGLQNNFGLSFIFIAHDLAVVRHIADEVAVMYLGKFVEYGDATSIYKTPRHPYTKALMSAAPVADPKVGRERKRIMLTGDVPSPVNPPSGCRFRTRCWKATDQCAVVEPQLIEVVPGHRVACHYPES
jgi:peptide/nickel transport system ATP-binding protein